MSAVLARSIGRFAGKRSILWLAIEYMKMYEIWKYTYVWGK